MMNDLCYQFTLLLMIFMKISPFGVNANSIFNEIPNEWEDE